MATSAQIRQTLNPLRVRGHIRPRESMHTTHAPSPPPSALNSPSQAPAEFCTSYFFSGPSRPYNVCDSPSVPSSPRHTSTMNSSLPIQGTRSGPAPTLFDGPSRPRHLMPIAQMYLDEMKSAGKSKP